jgi:hypothetical protein
MSKKNFWWLFEENENEKPKVKQKDKIETKEDLKKLMEVLENFVRNTFGIKIKINKLIEVHSTRDSRNFIFEADIEDKILRFYAKSKSGVDFGVSIETGGITLREGVGTGEVVFTLWVEKEEAKVLANEKYFVKILYR